MWQSSTTISKGVYWLILCVVQVYTVSTCVNSYGPEFCDLTDACSLTDSGCDARCDSIGCDLDCSLFADSIKAFYDIDFLEDSFYGYEFELLQSVTIGRLGIEISGLSSTSVITGKIQNAGDDSEACSGTEVTGDDSKITLFVFSEFTACSLTAGTYRAMFHISGASTNPTIRFQKLVDITAPSIMTNLKAIYGSWSDSSNWPTVFYTDFSAVRMQICTTGDLNTWAPTGAPSFVDLSVSGAKCATGDHGTAEAKETQICTFPFLLNGEWKYDCQNTNMFDGKGWCSTTTDFDTDGLWGWCNDCSDTDMPLGGTPGTCVEGSESTVLKACYRERIWDCADNGCDSATPCFEPVSGTCSASAGSCADSGLLNCYRNSVCGALNISVTGGLEDKNVWFPTIDRTYATQTHTKYCGYGYSGNVVQTCSRKVGTITNTFTEDCTAQNNPGGFTDNFEGSTIDSLKWTIKGNDNTRLSGAGMIAFSGVTMDNFIVSLDKYNYPLIVRTRILLNDTSFGHGIWIGSEDPTSISNLDFSSEMTKVMHEYLIEPGLTVNLFNQAWPCENQISGWFNIEIIQREEEWEARVEADDCSIPLSGESDFDKESLYIYLASTCSDTCEVAYFDYLYIQSLYSSCSDWREDGFTEDRVYTLHLGEKYTPFEVYCFGMNTANPLEYLEVDKSTTFSEFCDSNGVITKVEFEKVRLDLSDFTLDRADFGFTNFYIRQDEISTSDYNMLGRAQTCTSTCTAGFSIDLSATGFSLGSNTASADAPIIVTNKFPNTNLAYVYSCESSGSGCWKCWFDSNIQLEAYGYSGTNIDPLDDTLCESSEVLDALSSHSVCEDLRFAVNSGSDDSFEELTNSQLCTCTNQISTETAETFNACRLAVSQIETFYGLIIKCRAVDVYPIRRRRIGIEQYPGDGSTCQLPTAVVGNYYWLEAYSVSESYCSAVVDGTNGLTGYMYIYMGFLSGACYVYSDTTEYGEGSNTGEIPADYSSKFRCGIYVDDETCYDILEDDTCAAVSQHGLCDSQGDNCPVSCTAGCAAAPEDLSTSPLVCTDFNSSLNLFKDSASTDDMLLKPVTANIYGVSFTPNLGVSMHVTSIAIRVQGTGDITSYIWGPDSFDDCSTDNSDNYCQGTTVASDTSGGWVESLMSGDPPKLLDGLTYTISFEVSDLAAMDDTYLVALPESLTDYSGLSDLDTTKQPFQPIMYVPVMQICYYGATGAPSQPPTFQPSESPTQQPTEVPTQVPTESPTTSPTEVPSNNPSPIPTEFPTPSPTNAPTENPTPSPSEFPTRSPTPNPTVNPTSVPSPVPTTTSPTRIPTKIPTPAPQIPGAIEYNPQIFSFSESRGLDIYHYIFLFAASLICCGIICSRCPCCWAAGVDSSEKINEAIKKKVTKFQEIDDAPETEITTWQKSSKIHKDRQTIQNQARRHNDKRSRQHPIRTEDPHGAVSEGYIQNLKQQPPSSGIGVSQKQNYQL